MLTEPAEARRPARESLVAGPRAAYVASIVVFFLTVAFAHAVSPLNGPAPVAYDTGSMVLYFDRIINGRILEVAVPTTPKPLLSLVYGPVWELTHDWRAMVWIAVGVFAAATAAATLLAWRLAGPAAALFAGVALASSSMLVWEALRALATPWAILGWMVAGLAVTARPARYGIAGLALAFATLARVETLAIVGAAGAGLVLLSVGPRSLRRPVPRSAWLLMLGLLALPVMVAHDWLLIRDPWYWAKVSGAVAAQDPQPSRLAGVAHVLRVLRSVFRPLLVMTLLAVPGALILLRRRPVVGIGVVALAVGVTGFLLLTGYLGYVVPGRYAAPILVSAILSAAVTVGAMADWAVKQLRQRRPALEPGGAWGTTLTVCLAAAGVTMALLLAGTVAPRDQALRDMARARSQLIGDASDMAPAIREAVAGRDTDAAPSPLVLVPSQTWPALSLETGLNLTQIRQLPAPTQIHVAAGVPPAGPLVLYLRAADPTGVANELAVSAPTTLGAVRVVPLVSDPAGGRWLLRLEAAAR